MIMRLWFFVFVFNCWSFVINLLIILAISLHGDLTSVGPFFTWPHELISHIKTRFVFLEEKSP